MSFSSSYAEQIGREGSSRTIDETDLYVGSVQWNTQAAQIFLLYHVDVNSNPIPATWKTIRKVTMYAKSKAAYVLTIGGFSHNNLAENVGMENVALTANQIVGGGFFHGKSCQFFW